MKTNTKSIKAVSSPPLAEVFRAFQRKGGGLLTFLMSLMVITTCAQNLQITPAVQPAAGSHTQVGTFTLDYTIGEPVQTTLQNGNLMLTQGFEQIGWPIVENLCLGFFPDTSNNAHLASCANSSSDYDDFYNLQESWVPSSSTPIKYININFIVLHQTGVDDGTNFNEHSLQHAQILNGLVDQANAWFSSNQFPVSDPKGAVYIQDSKLRIRLSGVYHYVDAFNFGRSLYAGNNFNQWTNLGAEINVLLFGSYSSPAFPIGATNTFWQIYAGNYFENATWKGIPWEVSRNLLHEIFHTIGINHVYADGSCPGLSPWVGQEIFDPNSPDYLIDVFGPTCVNNDCAQPYGSCHPGFDCEPFLDDNDNCTSNFMGWKGTYLSPLQMGRIHRKLMLGTTFNFNRRYTGFFACGYGNVPFEVATNQTWDFDIKFYQDIIVKGGATLTITCKVNMVPGAKIIVEPGAKLFVDGGTITNAVSTGCTGMWNGIIVQGNKALPQTFTTTDDATAMSTNQGFVYLRDATIENAYEALRVWNPTDGWVSQNFWDNQGGTGGIVRAVNTNFINNRRSAEFMWYENIQGGIEKPNQSYFVKCNFTTNDNHNSEHPFSAHATAWGVNGVKFLGCTFKNEHTIDENTQDITLGTGIGAIDAGIIVSDYDPTLSIHGSNLVRNSFSNLHQGVAIANNTSPYTTKVFHAQFENCLRGIRNEGFGNCELVGNEITMGDNPAQVTNALFDYDEGIILNGDMAGFVVEQNKFEHTGTANHLSVGTRASSTGGNENKIYNNDFDAMGIGNLANRKNQNSNVVPAVGLSYNCNEQENSEWIDIASNNDDINILQPGIKIIQAGDGLNKSAGNTFSHNTGSPFPTTTDITNATIALQYRYYDSNDEPAYISTNVTKNSLGIAENTCPNNYLLPSTDDDPPGGCSTCQGMLGYSGTYSTHRSAYTAYKASYLALIDGGNTQARLAMVDTSTDADSLKHKLLSFAPNLSSAVLNAVILKKPLLVDDSAYVILRANAEGVTEEVLTELASHRDVSEWMFDSLRVARRNLTYRSYLLDTLTYHTVEKQNAVYSILQLIAEDTAGLDIPLYRHWLDSADGIWAKREIVNTYLHEGKFDTAVALLVHYDTTVVTTADSIQFNNYKDYVLSYKEWLEADSSIMRLDSAHLVGLKTIADDEDNLHYKGTQMARNILNFFYDSTYFTPPLLPEIVYAKKGTDDAPTTTAKQVPVLPETIKLSPVLKLYPNPAKDLVTIEYAGVYENSSLFIMNTLGVVLDKVLLTNISGKLNLNTAAYQNGVYLARIEAVKNNILKSKFVILK